MTAPASHRSRTSLTLPAYTVPVVRELPVNVPAGLATGSAW